MKRLLKVLQRPNGKKFLSNRWGKFSKGSERAIFYCYMGINLLSKSLISGHIKNVTPLKLRVERNGNSRWMIKWQNVIKRG